MTCTSKSIDPSSVPGSGWEWFTAPGAQPQAAGSGGWAAVSGVGGVGFPQADFDHRKTLAGGVVEDQPCDVLGRRVDVEHEHRLALGLQERKHRVVLVQEHFVIQGLIDPAADHALESREI